MLVDPFHCHQDIKKICLNFAIGQPSEADHSSLMENVPKHYTCNWADK